MARPNDLVGTLEEIEERAIKFALKRAKGNRVIAAKNLGISLRTIQRRIKAYKEHDYKTTVSAPSK